VGAPARQRRRVNREQFEHVVRAAADILRDEIVVIGSQAILAEVPDAPAALLRSMEADVFPVHDPGQSDVVDAVIGDGSAFHETFGYYAHGVGAETVVAPDGWRERCVRLEVLPPRNSGVVSVAWCIERHDLVLAKLAAGRPHDWSFAESAIRTGVVDVGELRRRARLMPEAMRAATTAALEGVIKRAAS
jgi:hypothetical protein